MQIITKYFGEIEIDDDKIVTFPEGLLGLEDYKKFAIFDMPENSKFICLQCIDEPVIAFLVVNPWDYFPDYDIQVSDEELATIGIAELEQLIVFSIITIGDNIENATANLLAPVVVNVKNKEAIQIVLNERKFTTKHSLFKEKGAV